MRAKAKVYRPKALIDGAAIDQEPGTSWIAVPDKFAGRKFTVEYGGAVMTVKDWRKEARMLKRFRDKYWQIGSKRKQYYTLGYMPFVPDVTTITADKMLPNVAVKVAEQGRLI